ncbi:septum site-determining protein DivIVA [bacterium BMS3Abin03]|nr:septum site-determining protein DivIVA [bacterium BMS3Abin03]
MKLTPLNIKTQEFTKSLRGYDIDEVKDYLEELSNEVESLMQENDELKEEIEILTKKLDEFAKIEKNLQNTLIKAQDSTSRTLESAKKQTGMMIKEAELKASQIIENAKQTADEIRDAVINLREEKNLFISRLRAIVNSQASLLEGKIQQADDEPEEQKKQGDKSQFNIDVDGIVDKLL